MTDYLADIIKLKEQKPKCSGYPIPNTHEVAEYELIVGKHLFSFACPKCGFGSGGSLTEEDSNRLNELIRIYIEMKK